MDSFCHDREVHFASVLNGLIILLRHHMRLTEVLVASRATNKLSMSRLRTGAGLRYSAETKSSMHR